MTDETTKVSRSIWVLIVDGEIADVSTHPVPLRNRAAAEYHAGRDAYVVAGTASATTKR